MNGKRDDSADRPGPNRKMSKSNSIAIDGAEDEDLLHATMPQQPFLPEPVAFMFVCLFVCLYTSRRQPDEADVSFQGEVSSA